MDRDAYRPDPPTGLGWSDYLAARGRYRASLAAGSEIARLERAFALSPDDVGRRRGGRTTEQPGPERQGRELPDVVTAVIVMFVVCAAVILVLLAAWLRAEHEVRVVRKRLERMKEVQRLQVGGP